MVVFVARHYDLAQRRGAGEQEMSWKLLLESLAGGIFVIVFAFVSAYFLTDGPTRDKGDRNG